MYIYYNEYVTHTAEFWDDITLYMYKKQEKKLRGNIL